jgi:hypothetical protein
MYLEMWMDTHRDLEREIKSLHFAYCIDKANREEISERIVFLTKKLKTLPKPYTWRDYLMCTRKNV